MSPVMTDLTLTPGAAQDLWDQIGEIISQILVDRAEDQEIERTKPWMADLDPEIQDLYRKCDEVRYSDKPVRARKARPMPSDEDRDSWA